MHNWKKDGLCTMFDREDFYDNYELWVKSDKEKAHDIDTLCQSCPMNKQCFAVGVSNKEWGVWGGVYLKDGKIDKEFNSHKEKSDWFLIWQALTMESDSEQDIH
jgi:hypothetical protein